MDILTEEERELASVTTLEALVYIAKGEHEKAVQITTKFIDEGLIDCSLYNARGLGYLNSHNAYRASQDFETAINLRSDIDCIYVNLALAYTDLNKIDQAIEKYKQAVELGHTDKDTLKRAIMLCEKNERYEDSMYFSNVQEGLIEP